MDSAVGAYRIYSEKECAEAPALDWPYICALHLLRKPVENAISEFLAFVGHASKADRAWMIEYAPDLLRFRNTHEWCKGDTTAYIGELQEAPTTLIAWLHRHLTEGQAVAVHDVRGLPRTARSIQAEFLRQGNQSILSIPVFYQDRLRGIVGFDTTVETRRWSRTEIKAMFQCASLIAQAKYATLDDEPVSDDETDPTSVLYVNKRGVMRGISPEEIIGLRSAGNYSEIWLGDGSMVLDSRPLGIWAGILPANLFSRIHRTTFINILHVSDIDRSITDKWLVRMRGIGQSWPVSRSYRKALRERLGF
ncbi:LytTR family transcriptional regulator DNA-binding domain-containing protein [Ochrobactrum vermis]|uniref:LytTR family transcriptional regulator DNA-binding domain-containing protein n=1 Tax=Ochrobactrum vermis TaxID=1827297 RepID=A0ABU8PJ27_9HYPH|nr:LytTR family transcriptional regulator DNA-binding domain-containing protein [Ochrobactrum vermis]PQZ27221.1 histidine kinase [Ochrobactrum vermis]